MKKCLCCFVLLLAACHTRHRTQPFSYAPVSPPSWSRVEETAPDLAATIPVVANLPVETKLPPPVRLKTIDEALAEVNGALDDAYFAYDRSDLSPEALAALRRDATVLCAILAEFPGLKILIEGHCDERGSAEYNLALGDRRARRAEEILRENGVPPDALEIVSYGKESPQCTEPTETCWQKNRRAHMSVKPR
jgi:peptidoglycan-associated lipoprotein